MSFKLNPQLKCLKCFLLFPILPLFLEQFWEEGFEIKNGLSPKTRKNLIDY